MFNNHVLRLAREYPEKINWKSISYNKDLSLKFIEENYQKLESLIFKYDCVSLNFINELLAREPINFDWRLLLFNPNLDFRNQETLTFIENHFQEISPHLDVLSFHPNLTENFVKRYLNQDWILFVLAENKNISPEFVMTYFPYKKYWVNFSERSMLPEEFIDKYFTKLNWRNISSYHHLTLEFMEKYLDWGECGIHDNLTLSIEIVEKYFGKINWKELSGNEELDLKIIRKYHYLLDWKKLSDNHYLDLSEDLDLIEIHQEEINWNAFSHSPYLTLGMVDKYKDKWNYDLLLGNQHLELEILEKYFNFNDPKIRKDQNVYRNHNLTFDFIKKYNLINENIPYIWCLDLDEISRTKNLKKYSRALAAELPQELLRREIRQNQNIYNLCVHEIKLNIRDTKLGLLI